VRLLVQSVEVHQHARHLFTVLHIDGETLSVLREVLSELDLEFWKHLLQGKNVHANQLVTHGGLILFFLLLVVDDLREWISLHVKQVVHQTIIDTLLNGSEPFSFLLRGGFLPSLVQLEVLSKLLKQFQHVLSFLVLDLSQEHRPQQIIVCLNMLGFTCHDNKSLCVFLVSLASLKEHNEISKDLWRHWVIVLHEVLHRVTQQNRMLLVNSNISNHLDQLWCDLVLIFMSNHMLNQLLKMFLLRVDSQCLQ